jgi:diacylglycerol kinase family enzyme
LTLSALLLATLAACGGPAPEPQDKESAREKGRDTDETVFDDMIQTQDRARAVEGLTLGRKAEMDAAVEQSEGDAAPEER